MPNDFLKLVKTKIREKGFFYCLKAGCLHLTKTVTFYLIGLVSFPFCLFLNIKFLNVLTSRIGHLCAEPDCYVKEGILDWHPRYNTVILAPKGRVANECLLSYWKKYFKIISSPLACVLLKPLSENPFTNFNAYRYCSIENGTSAHLKIQKSYIESGGRPLLVFEKSDFSRGRSLLSKLGVPNDEWFVCFHCREEGYLPGEGQTFRNADIDNYILAMEAVVERGGWVFRLGDQSMKAIPARKNIIDYAHLDIKSDWMDVFLAANCRFFLGSASGLFLIANLFGVPAATVNNAPLSTAFTYELNNVSIPMLMRRKGENAFLGFREVLDSPAANFRYDYLFSEAGVETVENSPEDIRDVVLEMLERSDGTLKYTEEDERLQAKFKSLMNPTHYSYGAISRIGRDFLKKYEYLL